MRKEKKSSLHSIALKCATAVTAFAYMVCIANLVVGNGSTEVNHKTHETAVSTNEIIELEPVIIMYDAYSIDCNESYECLIPGEALELSSDDEQMLLDIAMAEAEGEGSEGMALVMNVVLNRVKSCIFPNSIHDVIYEDNQFTPVTTGRFGTLVPNEDCYKALNMVKNGWDESNNATYFESTGKSKWHRNNLDYLFQCGNHYFYALRN